MVQDNLQSPLNKTYDSVFKFQLIHPVEQEAFLIGMLFGIFECNYKLYHATRRPGNTVEMPGILLCAELLGRLHINYRKQVGKKCKFLFNLIKFGMENDLLFKSRHNYIRHLEKIYKQTIEEEGELKDVSA